VQATQPATDVVEQQASTKRVPLKMMIVGDAGGKTCLQKVFLNGPDSFMSRPSNAPALHWPSTMGVDFGIKTFAVPTGRRTAQPHLAGFYEFLYASCITRCECIPFLGVEVLQMVWSYMLQDSHAQVHLQIWDTAGHEAFRDITAAYLKGTQGEILAYDITNRRSFENVCGVWLPFILRVLSPSSVMLTVVGCKCDQEEQRAVAYAEGVQLAETMSGQLGSPVKFFETSAMSFIHVNEVFSDITERMLKQQEKIRAHEQASGASEACRT